MRIKKGGYNMQKSFCPVNMLKVTASEHSGVNIGTTNLCLANDEDPNIYAPYDCVIVKIDGLKGTTAWFASRNEVEAPTFTDYSYFRCSLMDTTDFKRLNFYIGKTFKQGERCYAMGTGDGMATGRCVNIAFARGRFDIDNLGWYSTKPRGNWRITNAVHMWDAVYLKQGVIVHKYEQGSYSFPQNKYQWVYEPIDTVKDLIKKYKNTITLLRNFEELTGENRDELTCILEILTAIDDLRLSNLIQQKIVENNRIAQKKKEATNKMWADLVTEGLLPF